MKKKWTMFDEASKSVSTRVPNQVNDREEEKEKEEAEHKKEVGGKRGEAKTWRWKTDGLT